MKLLIFGHISHTGFGVVTEALGGRFVRAGVDVRVIAVNHRGEPVRGPLAGRVWPANIFGDSHGGNLSPAAIEGSLWTKLDPEDHWKPDAVLVVADVSGFMGHLGQHPKAMEAWSSVPVYHYCPIEGDNLSPGWHELWPKFQPVAMSDYGARVIGEFIDAPVPRIYHGVDSETFHPVSPSDPIELDGHVLRTKEDCKSAFGLDPKWTIALRADRLVVRKRYDKLLETFSAVFDRNADVGLVLHCRPIDDGLSLIDEIMRMSEAHRGRVKLTGAHDTWKGLTTAGLVALYNAADLYVSTTGGEGFGLTIAEAMACGVPAVATDWAADAETIGDGGILVPPLHDSYGDPVRDHSMYGMDWAVPDARAFVDPILNLVERPARRRAMGQAARAHIKRSFSWDDAAAQFLDLFGVTDAATARIAV